MKIKVSILIVNYNGEDLLGCFLKTLEGQSYEDFEVIIVDNASKDGSLRFLEQYKGERALINKIIPLESNRGFSGGNIAALNHARGEYLALLNTDTEPTPNWLESMVRVMDENPAVGICSSKIINHSTDIIDSAGDGFSSFLRGFKRGEGEKASLYDKNEYVMGACAGAALYRREMLEEIGFFDDDFFLIHEDTDLNLRAHLYGWKVMYVPEAVVYHKVRSTIGVMSDTAIYYTLRNSELVRIKNIPLSVFFRYMPYLILGMITEFFYFAIKHRRPFLYIKAKLDVLRLFPVMLMKRRTIMTARMASYSNVKAIITPGFERTFLKSKLRKFFND